MSLAEKIAAKRAEKALGSFEVEEWGEEDKPLLCSSLMSLQGICPKYKRSIKTSLIIRLWMRWLI